ncbi:MAG: YeeE/YedE thiosulfate transporter family protein [bacterium]
MNGLLSAVIFGFLFGFLLNKARLTQYDTIVNQFRFKDFTVLKYMLTTLVVAMSIVYLMRDLGLYVISNVPNTYVVGNLLGGAIFGVGMALGGF